MNLLNVFGKLIKCRYDGTGIRRKLKPFVLWVRIPLAIPKIKTKAQDQK